MHVHISGFRADTVVLIEEYNMLDGTTWRQPSTTLSGLFRPPRTCEILAYLCAIECVKLLDCLLTVQGVVGC